MKIMDRIEMKIPGPSQIITRSTEDGNGAWTRVMGRMDREGRVLRPHVVSGGDFGMMTPPVWEACVNHRQVISKMGLQIVRLGRQVRFFLGDEAGQRFSRRDGAGLSWRCRGAARRRE